MVVEVMRDNKPLMMLYPERRFFQTNEQSGTMVAIYSTLRHDLYVVYAGQSPDNQTPVIHAYLNPLVKWIWLGGVIVVLGTIVTLAAKSTQCSGALWSARTCCCSPHGANPGAFFDHNAGRT